MKSKLVSVSTKTQTTDEMPHYYDHEDYVSEKEMKGMRKCDREEQRRVNWEIRLEFYAENLKTAQFVKMIEKWYNDYNGRVPTLTMMKYAKMAKDLEARHLALWRPNESKAEINNRRPLNNSYIINRIVDETERLNQKFGWTD